MLLSNEEIKTVELARNGREAIQKIETLNPDVLILDCSFPDEMKVKGHLTPRETGEIAQECNCKKLVLSHLYPVCNNHDIAKQAKTTFKGEVTIAYDLMAITI